jgi:hypothetical protein
MLNSVIDEGKLELLLQTHWTEFVDYRKLLGFVLAHVRLKEYPVVRQDSIPKRQNLISVTKIVTERDGFEAWVEFTAARTDGVAVGTVVCHLPLGGEAAVRESYGTVLVCDSNLK